MAEASQNTEPLFDTRRALARRLVLIFLAAVVLRVGWVIVIYAPEERWAAFQYPDEEAYWQVASSLAAGDGLVDEFGYRATYMPGYPAFLAPFTGLPKAMFWARLVQAVLGAWVAPAVALLAVQWWRLLRGGSAAPGRTLAWMAGGLVAVDPFLIFFSGLLLTETLFAALLVSAWALVPLRARRAERAPVLYVGAGCLWWACVMLRPSALVLVVLATVAAIWVIRRHRPETGCVPGASDLHWRGTGSAPVPGGREAGGPSNVPAAGAAGARWTPLLMLVVVAVGLLPWAMRNQRVIGEWRWLTTRGGISLYDGLHPGASGASDLAHTRDLPEIRNVDERTWDAHFRARAWASVRADPMRAVRLAGVKLLRTWSLVPNVEAYRRGPAAVLSAVWMSGLLVLAAVGWWVHRRSVVAWGLLLLPVLTFTLLHMVFVGSVRYRVPVMPMIVVLSAAGAVALLQRWRTRVRRAG